LADQQPTTGDNAEEQTALQNAEHWLVPLLRPLKGRFAELGGITLFINLLALAVPIFTLQVYDRVVFHGGLTTLQGLVIGVFFAIAFDFILREVRAKLVQRSAMRIDVEISRRLFGKLTSLPLRVLERQSTPFWQMTYRDAEAVRDTIAGAPTVLLIDLPFVLVFMIIIYFIAAPIAWLLLIIVPAFMALAFFSSRAVNKSTEAEREANLDRDALLAELLSGRTSVKALNLGPELRDRWETRQGVTVTRGISRGAINDVYTHSGMTLSMLTLMSMTSVGALAIIDQEMTMGSLIAANMLTSRVIQPMSQLVGTWRMLARLKSSIERLTDLFAIGDDDFEAVIERPRPTGILTVENATFRYEEDGDPALAEIGLKIMPGGLLAVIGANGSGKSTFLKLLQGLYHAEEGRVLLDDMDLRQLSRKELAQWIGYVPQEPFLFPGSIAENIRRGREGEADETVLHAAKLAGVEDFVGDLPEGYATQMGETGRLFSAGQRQRIAIARALVGDPPVLLLDEPTASLDRPAEQNLINTLKQLAPDHTVIVVSHSELMLRAAASVLHFENGRIKEAGAADTIINRLYGMAPPPPSPAQQSRLRAVKAPPGMAQPPQPTSTPQPAPGPQPMSAPQAAAPQAPVQAPAKPALSPDEPIVEEKKPKKKPKKKAAKKKPAKKKPAGKGKAS